MALVRELRGQSYAWPQERGTYRSYRALAADTAGNGTVHIALGEAKRRSRSAPPPRTTGRSVSPSNDQLTDP
jgi:hypothetical protein